MDFEKYNKIMNSQNKFTNGTGFEQSKIIQRLQEVLQYDSYIETS